MHYSAFFKSVGLAAIVSTGGVVVSVSSTDAVEDSAAQKEAAAAKIFIQDLGNRAVSLLTDQNLSDETREQRFITLFKEYFDDTAIARFVLGQYWRQATDAEKQEYTVLFTKSISKSYATRLSAYDTHDKFTVGKASVEIQPKNKSTTSIRVESKLEKNKGNPVSIVWMLTQSKNGLKITDVVVEGVSMGITLRTEHAAVIQSKGGKVSGLIQALKDKS